MRGYRWVYGAALAASLVGSADAWAACDVSGAVTLSQCDGTTINAQATVGSGTLTVSDANVSAGLNFMPTNLAGAYASVLNLTGTTTIFRDDYPAIVMNSDGFSNVTSWDVTVNIGAGVTITTDMASATDEMGAVFINVKSPGNVVISNAGTVTYRSVNDVLSGAIYGNTDLGDTTITNSGTVESDGRGLYADTNDGGTTVTNSGSVTAVSEAIRANARGDDVLITNSGTLVSDIRSAAVGWSESGAVTITNSGTATSRSAAALLAWSTNAKATVTNSGTLYSLNTMVAPNGDYGDVAIYAYADTSGDVEVTNTSAGQIFASAGYGINGIADSGTVSIVNYGLIASAGGISVVSSAGGATVTNDGHIVAKGASNPTAVAVDASGTTTVTNRGTIYGGLSTTGGTTTFSNAGTWYLLSEQTLSGSSMAATTGIWSVNGTTTFDNSGVFGIDTVNGQATISGGFDVNNLAGGTLRLASGADLSIGGGLSNAGTIDLANGAANNTLSVGGAYTSSAGSLLKVDVSTSGSDTINVSGDLILAGKVSVDLAQGDYSSQMTYTLLESSGGLRFGTLELAKTYAYFDTSLAMMTASVELTVQRNSLSLADAVGGAGGNAGNAAAAIASLSTADPLYWAALQLTTDEVENAYGQMSGDAHASVLTGLSADSHYVRDASFTRLRQAFGDIGAGGGQVMGYGEGGPVAATPVTPFAVWTQGFGSVAHSEDGNAGREERRTLGTALGADVFLPLGEQVWRVGLAGSYAASRASNDSRNASADIDGYSAMLYAGTEIGAWAVRLGASATWNKVDSTRSVSVSSIDERLTADYWARTWQGFGEVGYRTKLGGIAAEPFVGLSYVVVDSDDVTETGDTLALAINGSTQEALYSTAGLRLQQSFGAVTLSGSAAWRHGFGDLTSDVTARFLAGGDSFTVQGVDTGRDTALLSAGAAVKLSATATAGLAYDGAFGADGTEHGGRADLRIRF